MTSHRNLRAALLVALAGFLCITWFGRPGTQRTLRLDTVRTWTSDFRVLSPARQAEALAAVVRIQERHNDRFFRLPEVLATGVGLTERGRLALHVYVSAGASRLAASLIGAQLEGFPVVVREAGPFVALQDLPAVAPARESDRPTDEADVNRMGWFERPVPIGISTGHPRVTAGTIGALVTDGALQYALSNQHIYAAENRVAIGDNLLQPGTADGGSNPSDAIGTLAAFEPVNYSLLANNRIDAALALTTQVDHRTPRDGYGAPRATTATARPGMKVKKYGRTTGLTIGTVDAINATVSVRYKSDIARFTGQVIICCSASAGGDSGSLVVRDDVDEDGVEGSEDRKPVALLFAGDGRLTIANPIDEVLDAFGVRIVGDDSP
jgi:hypothetical protein